MNRPRNTTPWHRGKEGSGKQWSKTDWEAKLKPWVEPQLTKVVEEERAEKKRKRRNKGKKREEWWRNRMEQRASSSRAGDATVEEEEQFSLTKTSSCYIIDCIFLSDQIELQLKFN